MATAGHPARLLPRAVLSTLVSALLVVTLTAPSQAQPGGGVPNPGSRPTPEGGLPLPDGASTRPAAPRATVIGPLAGEIAQKEIALETAVQQLQSIEPQLAPAGTAAELAEQQWLIASDKLEEAERTLDELVGESYVGAAALPPDLFIPQLPGLHAHAPAVPVDAPIGAEGAARDYIKARDEAQAAAAQLDLTQTAEQTLEEQAEQLEDTIELLGDELAELRDRNADLLVAQELAREEQAQENVGVSNAPVNGFEAHERAVRAVEHALSQLGKPYVWGAEGPTAYDCSGLVLWSYTRADVGASLPRVAADQYFGTRDKLVTRSAAVAQRGLLPGDLVFFSSGPSWQSIHHVGIYVGNGQMVHAPNSRTVVKVSPVWWSRFFAATRVFDAIQVEAPDGTPNPQPGPPPTPPGGGVIRPTTPPPTTPPPTTTPPTTPPPTTSPPTTSPPGEETEPPAEETEPPAEETEDPQEPDPPASEAPASESPAGSPTGSPVPA